MRLADLGWATPEAYRIAAPEMVDCLAIHPLALAVHLAFQDHLPLVLTPDAVWLCLAQSLATHIECNAEALRPRLVRHAGKLAIRVIRDEFVRGDTTNDWPGAVDEIVDRVRDHLGGRASAFVADFSTTSALDRTASQIALMGAMRHHFEYTVATRCGIPEVTLTGTPEDWASIRRRVEAFRELDLGWWMEVLDPVLAKLEATARGDIDREFWRRMYKLELLSGGDRSLGWLNTLFAYVGDPPVRNTFPSIDSFCFNGILLTDLPSGRTRVPFLWDYLGTNIDMELVGGLWGVVQDQQGALSVASGWVVSEARGAAPDRPSRGLRPRLRDFRRSPDVRGKSVALWLNNTEIETLASLEREREVRDQPTALQLGGAARLRSLDGIQHLHDLRSLVIEQAPALESVSQLAGMTSLRSLTLTHCPKLVNLGPVLETLPQLEALYLDEDPQLQLEDVLPIARMQHLTCVVLHFSLAIPAQLRGLNNMPHEITALRAKLRGLE